MTTTIVRLDASHDQDPAQQTQQEQYWAPGQIAHFGSSSRTLGFIGDVDDQLCGAFISQLQELIRQDPSGPIFIHINTGGGEVVNALAVYDFIRACPSPVCGIVTGSCMSAGLMILSACDYRLSTENSLFFYHQGLMSIDQASSESEVKSKASMYLFLNQKNDEIIRTRAKISKTQWKKDFAGSTSKYISAREALDYGLIDGLIEPEPKKVGLKEFINYLNGAD